MTCNEKKTAAAITSAPPTGLVYPLLQVTRLIMTAEKNDHDCILCGFVSFFHSQRKSK